MLKIGITGNMGSGKSVVCKIFNTLNIPTYNADYEAKNLYSSNQDVIYKVLNLFGKSILTLDNKIDLTKIKNVVFRDNALLKKLEAIIHPEVKIHFEEWVIKQEKAPYVLKEAALMIEAKSYLDLDFLVLVSCPENIRIQRIIERDNLPVSDIKLRLSNQMSEELKRTIAHFEIINNGKNSLINQVMDLHHKWTSNN